MLEDYNLFLEQSIFRTSQRQERYKRERLPEGGTSSYYETYDSDICFTTAGSLSALSSLGYTWYKLCLDLEKELVGAPKPLPRICNSKQIPLCLAVRFQPT